jgi:hypothetical protein
VVLGRFQKRYRALLLPLAATGAPLLYFKILTWTDAAWEIASQTSAYPHLPLLPLALGIGPLLLFSLLGLPRRFPGSDRERMLLLWPVAALIVYVVNEQFPPHAFNGLSLPLAILAVRGWSRLRLPALAGVAALAIAIVPAMTDPIEPLRRAVQFGGPLYLLTDDQYAAMKYMEGLPEGGVLGRPQLSVVVPGFTGLPVWAGHDKWTPDGDARGAEADALFAGGLSDWKALTLVGRTGAAYAIADCDSGRAVKGLLQRVSSRASRFGCVRVFELDAPALASARTRSACAGLRRARGPDRALRLEGKGAGTALVTQGGRIAVEPAAVRGFVEAVQADDSGLTLGGWTVDAQDPRSKPRVLVFVGGVVVAAATPDLVRRDVAAANPGSPVRSGYRARVAADDPEAAAACDSLRVLALSGGRASELARLSPKGG